MISELAVWLILLLPLASFVICALVIRPFLNHQSHLAGASHDSRGGRRLRALSLGLRERGGRPWPSSTSQTTRGSSWTTSS